MRIKWIFLFLFVAVTALFLYFHAATKEEKCRQEVLAALYQKDFSRAEESVAKLCSASKEIPCSLYKAHLELAKGNPTGIHDYLERAKRDLSKGPYSQEIVGEILCLEATHAFLTCSQTAFTHSLEKLQLLPPHPLFPLFEALHFYSNRNFATAKPLFEKHLLTVPIENHPRNLLAHTVGNQFSPSWIRLRLAHSMIELGEIQKGREIIDSELHKISAQTKDLQLAGNLFLGLSYLKEAGHNPYSSRHTLYKLASFYFKSIPSEKHFLQREKESAESAILGEIKMMIHEGIPTLSCEESSKTIHALFAFIHLLEEWGSETQLEDISETLGDGVLKSLPAQEHLVRLYCQSIKGFPSDCPFRSNVLSHCKEALLAQIHSDTTLFYDPLWQLLKTLESEPNITYQIARALVEEFPQIISKDSSDLYHTQRAIAFYQTIENDSLRHEQLALACANFAKFLWNRENEEKKATHLMQLALSMTSEEVTQELRYSLVQYLTDLYLYAESCNTRKRMCCIIDAFHTLKCGVQNLATPAKIANTIADGEYLLSAHQYPLAATTAEWVLKVCPHNQQALRLLGLSCFHQGEYQKAISALDQLSQYDEEVAQALAFCQIFGKQDSENHLAHHKTETQPK